MIETVSSYTRPSHLPFLSMDPVEADDTASFPSNVDFLLSRRRISGRDSGSATLQISSYCGCLDCFPVTADMAPGHRHTTGRSGQVHYTNTISVLFGSTYLDGYHYRFRASKEVSRGSFWPRGALSHNSQFVVDTRLMYKSDAPRRPCRPDNLAEMGGRLEEIASSVSNGNAARTSHGSTECAGSELNAAVFRLGEGIPAPWDLR